MNSSVYQYGEESELAEQYPDLGERIKVSQPSPEQIAELRERIHAAFTALDNEAAVPSPEALEQFRKWRASI